MIPIWLIIGLGGLGVYVGKKFFNNDSSLKDLPQGELNDYHVEKSINKKAGLSIEDHKLIDSFYELRKYFSTEINNGKNILVIGQPGAGKSSLIINLTDGNCSPIPEIGVMTDATNWVSGDYRDSIIKHELNVFVDTPGYDTALHPTKIFVDQFPFYCFDKILFVTNTKFHDSDVMMVKKLALEGEKVFYIRTFIDSYSINDENPIKVDLMNFGCKKEQIYFVSNKNKDGISKLKENICL